MNRVLGRHACWRHLASAVEQWCVVAMSELPPVTKILGQSPFIQSFPFQ